MEIIVVDDASEDNTAEIVRRFDVNLLHVHERKGASFCRNLGAKEAQGDIVCFLDSDCTVEPSWLEQLVSVFENPVVGACGGLVDSLEDQALLDQYEQVKSSLHMGTLSKDSRNKDPFFYLPSCNLAVRKDVFLDLGGFNNDMDVGEDVDLCWRIIDHGFVIEYRPSARVFHRHRNTVWPFCRRRFDYGTSEPVLQSRHREREKTLLLWPKAFVFWGFITLGFITGFVFFWLAALFWFGADVCARWRKATRPGLPLGWLAVVKATLRSNLSFLYHLCSFASRYYLLWLPVVFILSQEAGWVLVAAHLVVVTVEFIVHAPKLNILAFLFYFSLEQLSYQAGVWFRCLTMRFFAPVNPRIRFRTER